MYKKINKIIASMIVFIMMIANMSTIGIHIGEVVATNSELNTQNSKTNNSNVEFDSYFVEEQNKTYDATKNIGEENKIVAQISVKNAGYLKDARIQFTEPNFEISQISSDRVSKVENNEIILNQINSGENVNIDIPIKFVHTEKINLTQFNKTNMVNFTATYIDNNGKSHSIEKQISLGLKWTANTNMTVTGEISKYMPYEINGQKGIILQMLVKTSIEGNLLPLKESQIEISVPKINGINPTEVKVFNSDNNIELNNNYSEDKITITARNKVTESNEVYWSPNGITEYFITCKYSEENLNTTAEVDIDINANTKTYSYNELELNANFEQKITLNEKIGEIVDFKITSNNSLSKGYMYANYKTMRKLPTQYTQKIEANIDLPEFVDQIELNMKSDKFDNIFRANSYYKALKIAKSDFNKIFGEDGWIEVYSNEQLIGSINENAINEQLYIELDNEEITIRTSRPIESGKLAFELEKEIKAENIYSESQLQDYRTLNEQVDVKVLKEIQMVVNKKIGSVIELVEPVAQVELQISDANISTITTKQNVELRAILKTDSEYNKLYTNPTILINLPSYIENIEIKSVEPLFDDELTIENCRIVENQNGTKQIIITTRGTQTKYNIGSTYGGTNIVIMADITANKLTPTKEEQITMKCINLNEEIQATANIKFIAPVGIVAINKIDNFKQNESIMAITNDEQGMLEVTSSAKNATAEIQLINNYENIINNIQILGRTFQTSTQEIETNNSLNNNFNATMLGAINTNGMENVSIYYSENGTATKDLQNEQNGWTTQVTDFSKVKSYLIVLNNYTMNIGETVKFTYDVQIPENLEYDKTISSLYTAYFNNVQENQTIQDKVVSRKITLTTGVAPTLQVELTSNSEQNSIVREGQYVKFKAKVKNTGTVDALNTVLKIKAPNGNIYTYRDNEGNIKFTEDVSLIENVNTQLVATYVTKHTEYVEENYDTGYVDSDDIEKTINIGTIKAGETTQVEYELKVESIEKYKKNAYLNSNGEVAMPNVELNNIVNIKADDMQKEVNSNVYKLRIAEGYMKIVVNSDKSLDYTLIKGNEINYSANISSLSSGSTLKNVIVTMQLSKGVTVKNAQIENLVITDQEIKYTTTIDNQKNTVTYKIEELPIGAILACKAQAEVGDIEGNITTIAEAVADGVEKHYSNVKTNKVEKLTFTIKQQILENQYVKEKEQITYTYEIENTSNVYTNSFKFENSIPNGMKFVSAKIVRNGDEQDIVNEIQDGKFILNLNSFKGKAKIKIKVTMEAELLPNGITEKEFVNYATISGDNFETIKSNEIKTVIEYNSEAHKKPQDTDDAGNIGGGDDNNNDNNGRYIISGLAWIDKNKDGQRNEQEELLTGIEVRLLNKNTNEIVKDIDSGVEKITYTSSNGEYRFTNLEKGEYLVVFLYNNYKYELTQYRNPNVSSSVNSDVISIDMDINGKVQTVAISDTIKITNSNIRNIDIGLCESLKSSMNLDKYISAVTVTYGNTVKTYNYDNSKLVKVEIPAKELSNATVIVDYKIKVTNTGAVANYVKKIVDYIPKDMKFNAELNRDWYQSSNGDLYNSSLANKKLESGETAEVTLTLTRKMTDTNTGIVNNNAEIYELYNEEGIIDEEATAGNKVSGEKDMSGADLVISVKTGDAVIYTSLIATVICAFIGVSTYYIRKKVLRRM